MHRAKEVVACSTVAGHVAPFTGFANRAHAHTLSMHHIYTITTKYVATYSCAKSYMRSLCRTSCTKISRKSATWKGPSHLRPNSFCVLCAFINLSLWNFSFHSMSKALHMYRVPVFIATVYVCVCVFCSVYIISSLSPLRPPFIYANLLFPFFSLNVTRTEVNSEDDGDTRERRRKKPRCCRRSEINRKITRAEEK